MTTPTAQAVDEPPPWPGVKLWRGKVGERWMLLTRDEELLRPVARVWGELGGGTWWRLATEDEERVVLRAAAMANVARAERAERVIVRWGAAGLLAEGQVANTLGVDRLKVRELLDEEVAWLHDEITRLSHLDKAHRALVEAIEALGRTGDDRHAMKAESARATIRALDKMGKS
jgi:hypothetical protein